MSKLERVHYPFDLALDSQVIHSCAEMIGEQLIERGMTGDLAPKDDLVVRHFRVAAWAVASSVEMQELGLPITNSTEAYNYILGRVAEDDQHYYESNWSDGQWTVFKREYFPSLKAEGRMPRPAELVWLFAERPSEEELFRRWGLALRLAAE